MKPNHLSTVALLALLAGGCANIPSVGPDYHEPETKTPAHWSEPLAGGETNAAAATAAWWKNFHDPELDSLIERAARSNLDLHIAQARVREARAQYSMRRRRSLADGGRVRLLRAPAGKPEPTAVLGPMTICRRAYRLKTTSIKPVSTPRGKLTCSAANAAPWKRPRRKSPPLNLASATSWSRCSAKSRAITSRRARLSAAIGNRQRKYPRAGTIAGDHTKPLHQRPGQRSRRATSLHRCWPPRARSCPRWKRRSRPRFTGSEVLLGQPPGALRTELAAVAPIPARRRSCPSACRRNCCCGGPTCALAERQLAAATANIGVAKSDLFPKFYLTGVAGSESISASDWFTAGSRFWSVGPDRAMEDF